MIMTTTDIVMIIVAALCTAGAIVCAIKLVDFVVEIIEIVKNKEGDD